jgi:hypothetical protein
MIISYRQIEVFPGHDLPDKMTVCFAPEADKTTWSIFAGRDNLPLG